MKQHNNRTISEKLKLKIASPNISDQIIGTIFSKWKRIDTFTVAVIILASILISILMNSSVSVGEDKNLPIDQQTWKCGLFVLLNLLSFLVIRTCRRLNNIFNIRKQETRITWSYVFMLSTLCIWVISFVLIFKISEKAPMAAAMGAIGAMLSWIFQDKIRGAVTFFHLRYHDMLNIGDWVKIPAKNVDGEVSKVSMTSVTVANWDTTTSIIPITAFSTEHFINLQNMLKGNTHGRQMLKTFIIDTRSIHPLSDKEATLLATNTAIAEFIPEEQIHAGASNASLLRIYLYHWLMSNPNVSCSPRLIVRWLEQEPTGMPLQLYAFITDSGLASFEWQQSLIIEHVLEALAHFQLRLYQSPTSFDLTKITEVV